jgi:hypothetical protein
MGKCNVESSLLSLVFTGTYIMTSAKREKLLAILGNHFSREE